MRVSIFEWAAAAAVFLISVSGAAAQTPPAQSLANTCQSSVAPKARIDACAALLGDANLVEKLAAPVFYSIGFSQIDLHHPEDALINFSHALERDPAFWPAAWARAELLEARRDHAAAIMDWGRVLERQPALAGAYARRAEAEDNLGQSEAAVADYTKALATASAGDPVDQFYSGRAVTHAGAQQLGLAIADYDAALQHNDQDAASYAGRGRAAFLQGDAAAALSDLRKAAERDPTNLYDALWLYLAETEAGQDGADDLRGRIGQLPLGTWPGPLVRVFLGDAQPDQVQPAATLPAGWTPADRQAGAACETAFFLGEFYRLQGKKDQAIASFRAALATHVGEFVEYRAAASELARLAR